MSFHPYRFRSSDLGIPVERIDEMTRALAFAGHRYLIVHGELESFPAIAENRVMQDQR